jgi:hypothetical protein
LPYHLATPQISKMPLAGFEPLIRVSGSRFNSERTINGAVLCPSHSQRKINGGEGYASLRISGHDGRTARRDVVALRGRPRQCRDDGGYPEIRSVMAAQDSQFQGTAMGWLIHGALDSWRLSTKQHDPCAGLLLSAGAEVDEALRVDLRHPTREEVTTPSRLLSWRPCSS